MLEMLLAAALMDTVIAFPDDAGIFVHEWGVVTFTGESVAMVSDPDILSSFQPPPFQDDDQMVVRAPVVYFYGEPFSGTFSVTAASGTFIETWPEPAFTDGRVASWSLTASNGESDPDRWSSVGRMPCISPELLELWRSPPSMALDFLDGSSEKYIYYECSLAPEAQDSYYPVSYGPGGPELDPEYNGNIMRFVRTENGVLPLEPPSEGMVPLLCEWAGGSMKTQELEGMWKTWEDWIYRGSWSGDTLAVFPLPASTVELITDIELITEEWVLVEYSRFYLGMMSL